MATSMNAISCPVVSRPGSAVLRSVRKPTAPKRNMKVMAGPIGDTTGMSAEQINFLKRRAGLIPDPLAAPGKAAAPAKGAAPAAYKAPAAAVPAGGFSQIQLDFMNRKKAEAGGATFQGYDASPAPAGAKPAAPAYKAPAAAAPSGGLSQEQIDFMNRKKSEAGGAPFRGYDASPAPAAPKAAASWNAPTAAAPVPAGGFSQIQLDFMNRKKAEAGGATFQGYDASPAPAGAKPAAPAYKAPAAAAPAGGFSQIQLDFMNRKKAEAGGATFQGYDASPAPAGAKPAAPAYKAPAAAAPAGGFSQIQLDFMNRKKAEAGGATFQGYDASPAPAGAKPSAPAYKAPAAAAPAGGFSQIQLDFMNRKKAEAGGATFQGYDASPAPAGAKPSAPAYKAPAAAAPAGGLSQEQIDFMNRKKAEAGGAPFRGYDATPAPAAAAPAYKAPAAAAPAGGFSQIQLDFMNRKKAEAGGATFQGYDASPAPAGAKPSAPAYKAPAAAAPAGGLSQEQIDFMNRKKAEAGGAPFRGYDASPAPAAAAPAYKAPAAAVPAGGFSQIQLDFMNRKKAEAGGATFQGYDASPAPAAVGQSKQVQKLETLLSSSKSAPTAGGLSQEQIDFMDRKKAEAAGLTPGLSGR